MMRQCNTVDMTRRSPSYEVRLAKYSSRAFEVYVPTLRREDIDPTIFERSIARIQGLARLLVLEKMKDGQTRDSSSRLAAHFVVVRMPIEDTTGESASTRVISRAQKLFQD